jgi:SAM-dependent methyltransferase
MKKQEMMSSSQQIALILRQMREVYSRGGNAMEWCREYFSHCGGDVEGNDLFATLVAYDLQSGSYTARVRQDRNQHRLWCQQVAGLLDLVCQSGDTVLEVGVGEATTLAGALQAMKVQPNLAIGFDVSWSRVAEGRAWLEEMGQKASLFVGDLFSIPLADSSVDVVYSSHSLEPNGGKELEALAECLRVSRKSVVLIEPIYELALPVAQERMRLHGYVKGLKKAAEKLGAEVAAYHLLDYSPNPLNPSGVIHLRKPATSLDQDVELDPRHNTPQWRCPMTGVILEPGLEFFVADELGLVYPVLQGVPMLRPEHAIVASKIKSAYQR